MPKKGLISLQPEWLERERQRHEKQLADIDRKCNWLSDKNFSKTPAVIRMLDEDRSVAQICRRYDLSRDTFDRFRRQCPSVREAFERKEARRAARFTVRSL